MLFIVINEEGPWANGVYTLLSMNHLKRLLLVQKFLVCRQIAY